MRVTRGKGAEASKVDMTPLIDLCFTLLIFLLSCNEISRVERAQEIQLPLADMASPEEGEEMDRWMVNLTADGMAMVAGAPLAINSPQFRAVLREQAESKREKAGGFSERSLVIRADRRMKFQYVQQLILECQRLKLWKVKLQVIMPEAEDQPRRAG